MKPLWSNKEISLPIAGIESETEMLRVAELLRYILRFHFTFMAGAWGLKMYLPPLSIIQANTPKQIYNSTTGELIQFIGAGVFFFSPSFLFFFSFFPPQCWTLLHLLFNFHCQGSHLTSSPPFWVVFLRRWSSISCNTHMPQFNYLTDLQGGEKNKGQTEKKKCSFSCPQFVQSSLCFH